jgi:hypothetical protein
MDYYYSPSTNGFYVTEIHGTNIPEDAVAITSQQHAELLFGQASGQQIIPDENGFPILIQPVPVFYIPTSITMRQCRLQLLADGKLDQVETAIASMPKAAQIEWEYAATVERSNPLVPALMQVAEWDENRVDQLFIDASKL